MSLLHARSTILHTPIRYLPRLAMGRRLRDFLEGEKEGEEGGESSPCNCSLATVFCAERGALETRIPICTIRGKWEVQVEHTT
jgi:hypothetical protein